MDWSKIKKVYLIGIKGQGMTMLAQYLAHLGIKISGSDTAETFTTDAALRAVGAQIKEGFKAANLDREAQLIIYSTAYNESNPEVAAARSSGKKTLTYGEALANVFNQTQGIAVAGSHGKTTVSAWLGFVLQRAGLSPTVLVGARVEQFNGSALLGKSNLLVAEADEYQNKLALLNPKMILLNNIDYDHPDFYPDAASYLQAFADFITKLPAKGTLIANYDQATVKTIGAACSAKVVSYGLQGEVDFLAQDIKQHAGRQYFKVLMNNDDLGEFNISLSGAHNVSNALAVLAAALELGAELLAVRQALSEFNGVTRRWQRLGEYRGAIIYDDYAHHPAEIKAALSGARQLYPDKKLVVVFCAHTFSRTAALLDDFAASWQGVDELIVLPIFASARESSGKISSKDLIERIKIIQPDLPISYQEDLNSAASYLKENLRGNEVVVLMGAGDVFKIGEELIK